VGPASAQRDRGKQTHGRNNTTTRQTAETHSSAIGCHDKPPSTH
jgi:hypothetical protein